MLSCNTQPQSCMLLKKTHTCSHLMITLHLYLGTHQLYYCRERGETHSPFPPLLNDWRLFGTSLPSYIRFHSSNIWIAMVTAFILRAPHLTLPSRFHPDTTVSPSLYWGERMLLVTLIKSKWFHEGRWSRSTSRATRSLWGKHLCAKQSATGKHPLPTCCWY